MACIKFGPTEKSFRVPSIDLKNLMIEFELFLWMSDQVLNKN